ncbi:MAG: GrpB family protein [Patescibacteria group bacterium]|nr:GrpB family protein [Patescibacteria group bacterium]
MIGLKRGTVRLVIHNLKWSQSFEREKKKIKKIFSRKALDIQHVGSTSVPGMVAKPIIDIALLVPSITKVGRYEENLKKIGYNIKKDDTNKKRLFFTKGPEKKRTHYLHIGKVGSGYIEDMILFRDYLCEDRRAAEKYSELKEKLAKKYQNSRKIYTAKKEKLIKEIVKKAKKSPRIKK